MLGESIWAYLPVGPLERHFREGDQGVFEKRFRRTLKRVLFSYFGGTLGKPLLVIYIDALFQKGLQGVIQRMRPRPVEIVPLLLMQAQNGRTS
jgi:hypothetical protein